MIKSEDRTPLGTKAEVAQYLKVPERTLDQWNYLGKGPRPIRVGRYNRYRWSDVEQWLDEQALKGREANA